MRRQYKAGTQHGASTRTIAQLAVALRTSPEWLMSGTGPEEREPAVLDAPYIDATAYHEHQIGPAAVGLGMAGVVAAGQWLEPGVSAVEPKQTRVPADPRYPAHLQRAYEVHGTAIDRVARPGDFLIVVDRLSAGLTPRSGDLVIVTRTKQDLREVTARRLQVSGQDIELRYNSTDPRYDGTLIQLRAINSDSAITVGEIVVAVYRPLT